MIAATLMDETFEQLTVCNVTLNPIGHNQGFVHQDVLFRLMPCFPFTIIDSRSYVRSYRQVGLDPPKLDELSKAQLSIPFMRTPLIARRFLGRFEFWDPYLSQNVLFGRAYAVYVADLPYSIIGAAPLREFGALLLKGERLDLGGLSIRHTRLLTEDEFVLPDIRDEIANCFLDNSNVNLPGGPRTIPVPPGAAVF